jgi:hypothetical protein
MRPRLLRREAGLLSKSRFVNDANRAVGDDCAPSSCDHFSSKYYEDEI